MATIVQPYNAWREQLAAQFLGPLLGSMINQGIQRGREAEQNRKQNAFYDTVMQSLNAGQQKDLLTGQPMPEGYDNNGWAKSFHSTFTPITQYDMGTDPLTRSTSKSIPTALDVMNAVSKNLATDRFSMLNRDSAMKMFEPYMKANEYERAKQQRQDVLDAYSGAPTPQGQYDALFGGLVRGDIDNDILKSWSDMYQYNHPHLQAGSVNTGDRVNMYSFNPTSGQFTFDYKNSFPVNMTPYQAANLNLGRQELEQRQREHNDNYGLRVQEFLSKQDKEQYDRLTAAENSILAAIEEANNNWAAVDDPNDPQTQDKHMRRLNELKSNLDTIRALKNDMLASSYGSYGQGRQNGNAVSKEVYGHLDLINKYANRFGIEPELMMAIMQIESGGNPNMSGNGTTVSPAGARGVMQFMPDTARAVAKRLGLNPEKINIDDPETSIMLGAAHLKELSDKYGGDIEKIAWAYNAGAGAVDKKHLPKETRNYIPQVASIYRQLKNSRQQQMQQPSQPVSQQTVQTTQEQAAPPKDNSVAFINGSKGEKLTASQYQALKQSYRNDKKYKDLSDQEIEQKVLEDLEKDGYLTPSEWRKRVFGYGALTSSDKYLSTPENGGGIDYMSVDDLLTNYGTGKPKSNEQPPSKENAENTQAKKTPENNNQGQMLKSPLTLSNDVVTPNMSAQTFGADLGQNDILKPPTVIATLSNTAKKGDEERKNNNEAKKTVSPSNLNIPDDDGSRAYSSPNYEDEDTRYRSSMWDNAKMLWHELAPDIHPYTGAGKIYDLPDYEGKNEQDYSNTWKNLNTGTNKVDDFLQEGMTQSNNNLSLTDALSKIPDVLVRLYENGAPYVIRAVKALPPHVDMSSYSPLFDESYQPYQKPVAADNPPVDTFSSDPLLNDNEKVYDWNNEALRQAEFERMLNEPYNWQPFWEPKRKWGTTYPVTPYALGETTGLNTLPLYSQNVPLSPDILTNSYNREQNITPSYMSGNVNLPTVYPAIDILGNRKLTTVEQWEEYQRQKYIWDMLRGNYKTWQDILQRTVNPRYFYRNQERFGFN